MKQRPENRRAGLSMVEILIAVSLLTLFLLTVGFSLHAEARVAREMSEDLRVQARSQELIDILVTRPFGSVEDSSPSSTEVSELFDGDDELGTVSLWQLAKSPTGGWTFSLAAFPVAGSFRVVVDQDLREGSPEIPDGGGEIDDLEKSDQILSIRIYFNDRLVLRTLRSQEGTL